MSKPFVAQEEFRKLEKEAIRIKHSRFNNNWDRILFQKNKRDLTLSEWEEIRKERPRYLQHIRNKYAKLLPELLQ